MSKYTGYYERKQDDEWEVEKPRTCFKNCDHITSVEPHKIIFSAPLWDVLQAMLLKFPQDEWQMMLSGKVTDGVCRCDGYYITKQEVTSAHVYNKDCVDAAMIKKLKLVAGIHSHVNMQTSPSQTDIDDSVMSLIDYHIILNNRKEMTGMRKAKLPCGGLTTAKCDCYIEGLVDLAKVEIKGLENISKREYSYQPLTPAAKPAWRDIGHRDYDRDYDDEKITQHMLQNGGY